MLGSTGRKNSGLHPVADPARLFDEYDIVRTLVDYESQDDGKIRKGSVGTIVHLHLRSSYSGGFAYMVEFTEPATVVTFEEGLLEKAILDPVNRLERWLLKGGTRRAYFAAHFISPRRQVELFEHAGSSNG
jgi:hypothetical protein